MPSGRAHTSEAATIMRLLYGQAVARVIHAAAEIGLADHLNEQPVDASSLAEATSTHAASLARFLRVLAAIGMVHETDDRRYSITPLGATLRTSADSMRAFARVQFTEMHQRPWEALPEALRTGAHAFRQIFGTDLWSYRAAHPEVSALFNEAMQSVVQGLHTSLAAHYPFGNFQWILDVGGGNGSLLISILEQNPSVRGTLFEFPHVAPKAREHIAAVGLVSRCEVVEGDASVSVPPGADAYMLKHVIHGRDDAAAVILRNCRAALPKHGKVIVIERVLPERIDPADEWVVVDFIADLNMMLVPGGRERTEAEYSELFARAGLHINRIIPTSGYVSIIEADPD
jgi:DNA-binding HxlR family transcriptional regulator